MFKTLGPAKIFKEDIAQLTNEKNEKLHLIKNPSAKKNKQRG